MEAIDATVCGAAAWRDCPTGCRFCAWLPAMTKAEHGCPASDVTQAACRVAAARRKKSTVHTPAVMDPGFAVFRAEYHPSAVATTPALLQRAGGAGPVLAQMWRMLPQVRSHWQPFCCNSPSHHTLPTGVQCMRRTSLFK